VPLCYVFVCERIFALEYILGTPKKHIVFRFSLNSLCTACISPSSSKNTDITTGIVACLPIPSCLIRNTVLGTNGWNGRSP